MKLSVLVPSAEYKGYAGARIRYGRIAPALEGCGIELALQDIAQFDPQAADCDILLISKCHDARSLVIAAILSAKGCLVGVDLFDDYFSQSGDSRLSRYRSWLGQLLQACDFALCSTPAMAAIADRYRAGVRTYVMDDPAPETDAAGLAQTLARKVADLNERRRIRVAWFGVGDNPFFRVGIDDLAAFGGYLGELAQGPLGVDLTVLTNERALTADGLSELSKLPVAANVELWTEDRECTLLEEAHVAFLPVGTQNFSTAKSLNRAVTALSAGCQVLSAGHALYEPFDPLIYRDPVQLRTDLGRGSLRFSAERVGVYRDLLEKFADAEIKAAGLVDFLASLTRPQQPDGPLTLVHGHATNGAAHKMVQAAGGISVASPYSTVALGYDVVFRDGAGGLSMFVSEKAARRLSPDAQRRLKPAGSINDRPFLEVVAKGSSSRGSKADVSVDMPLPMQLATYRLSMSEIRRNMTETFGAGRILLSEQSPLPFPAAG